MDSCEKLVSAKLGLKEKSGRVRGRERRRCRRREKGRKKELQGVKRRVKLEKGIVSRRKNGKEKKEESAREVGRRERE